MLGCREWTGLKSCVACVRATFRVVSWCSPPAAKSRIVWRACNSAQMIICPSHLPCRNSLRAFAPLGRRFAEEPPLNLRVDDLTFDLANHEVYRGARRIELSARELMLLKVLMREPGRVFTRTELCERVWEHAHEYDTKLVEVFIGRLRKKSAIRP